jgi:hypothetical protein
MFGSWFISPWQAARMSLEAQRAMAFSFLRFASGGIAGPAATAPTVEPRTVEQSGSVTPARPVTTKRPKTVAARQAPGVSKKRARPKSNKRTRRKQKNKGR